MQVKDLIKTLQKNYKSTDELVVLFYGKDEFEFDTELTDKAWSKIVKTVDLESADQILSETISEMVGE